MRDCIKRIVESSKGTLNVDEAKELLRSVDVVVKRRVKDGFDYDESVNATFEP